MKYILGCIVFGLFSNANLAQTSDSIIVKKLADEVMYRSEAYENLRYLCKTIGPRLSGSANAEKAVMATARMLREAGADTVYLQPCTVPHWVRGQKEKGYVKIKGRKKYNLNLCALGNTIGTGSRGVSGEVVEVSSFDALQKLGMQGIKGKLVFFNFPMNPTYFRTSKAYSESGPSRYAAPSAAARYGAIGILVRSLASNLDIYPHTGVANYNDSFPKIPAVAISTIDAEWLHNQLEKNTALTVYFKTDCGMLAPAASFNVIGELRGSRFPAEIITVGGHLDSWDLGEGAHDDGAGCVQSIEVIRSLKASGLHPKRTVRAVMFMNEENGSAGGNKYFEEAKRKNEKHVFALESDHGGFTPRGFNLVADDARKKKILDWKPLFYNYGVYDFSMSGSGADIDKLNQLGAVLAGSAPDSQRYFDVHHAATDVFESVSKRELDLGAVNMAAFVWLVSEYGF